MDKIEFIVEKRKVGDYESDSVRIFINGKDLIALVKDVEIPFATSEGSESIAGAYDGLTSAELYESLTQGAEKSRILECVCGGEGCWPFMARIIASKGKIVWSDFEQPHRKSESHVFWDYSTLGKFTFVKQDYERQVAMLKITE